jgi:hypothetical protein
MSRVGGLLSQLGHYLGLEVGDAPEVSSDVRCATFREASSSLQRASGGLGHGDKSSSCDGESVSSVDDSDLSEGPSETNENVRENGTVKALRFHVEDLLFTPDTSSSVPVFHQYRDSMCNWTVKPMVGKAVLRPGLQFGPYTVPELVAAIQDASDAQGFGTYCHKGPRCSKIQRAGFQKSTCSLRFGCECGRQRYGKEKKRIDEAKHEFHKDADEIVPNATNKRKAHRNKGGYRASQTQRQRIHMTQCPFALCVTSVGSNFTKDSPCMWTLNGDKRSHSCFNHKHHNRRKVRIRMSQAIKDFIVSNGATSSPASLADSIFGTYKVQISEYRIIWFLRSNGITLSHAQRRIQYKSGSILASIQFQLRKQCSVLTLLIHVDTGHWFTGDMNLDADGKICAALTRYHNGLSPKPLHGADPTRTMQLEGADYLIWVCAWVATSAANMFNAYPSVCQLDCQHGVTSQCDGLNAVGVDGNGHNIIIMRAYIGAQDALVFRWILFAAFPKLIPKSKEIRTFFCDGCPALNKALRQACGIVFPVAKCFRCLWHLVTKAFEDTFGFGDWQTEVKRLIWRLRKCESDDELRDCAEFVLRKVADMSGLGKQLSCVRSQVLDFLKARLQIASLWVLKDQLRWPTRGCAGTTRVESTHGHDRRESNITARNTFLTTTKKYLAQYEKTLRNRQAWAARQLSTELLRSPINPDISIFSKDNIDELDHIALPWAIEALEDQALLALRVTAVLKKKGHAASQRNSESKLPAAEFACWCEEDLDDAVDHSSDEEIDKQGEGNGDDDSGDEEDEDDAADDDVADDDDDDENGEKEVTSRGKRLHEDEFEDDDSNSDNSEFQFDNDEFLHTCAEQPMPENATFFYKRIRLVQLFPELGQSGVPTGNYIFFCTCGFPIREGVSCRHILAVLLIMLTDAQGKFDLSKLKLDQLLNMNICSKDRYHAVLNGHGQHFPFNNTFFKPAIPRTVAMAYLSSAVVAANADIPASGLPEEEECVVLHLQVKAS